MPRLNVLLLFLLLFSVSPNGMATDNLRIEHLQRCGDLLAEQEIEVCLRGRNLDGEELQILLDGKPLSTKAIERSGETLHLRFDAQQYESGPLWVARGEARSNPVWLSLGRSHVVAASEDEVAQNMDGLTTYLDLVSVLVEESKDGHEESQRLAEKYGAQVVGAIPPLNVYQLRLPVKNLIERDALVLRLGAEVSIDAIIVEESGAEAQEGKKSSGDNQPEQDEWAANRFLDAVHYYRKRIPAEQKPIKPHPIRIGIIERDVDFDAPDFADYRGECQGERPRACLYARDASKVESHGSTVAGILAAGWNDGGNSGFLRGLEKASGGFEIIVDRNSDAGITANIAASVNLVEDGARVLNWSWGIHRIGAKNIEGDDVDSLLRSGIAMSGYEELLEEFFLWLRREHPQVVVVNSAGNGSSFSGTDEYRLPSSFITDQLLVVGGHQRSERDERAVDDPRYATRRESSNLDTRVDITAAACVQASTRQAGQKGEIHCGTSYATPLVTGVVAAMLSINPELTPAQLRMLLRRSAMTIGGNNDFEAMDADDLTAPILPSERDHQMKDRDIGRSARLDMQKALDLAVQSRDRVR